MHTTNPPQRSTAPGDRKRQAERRRIANAYRHAEAERDRLYARMWLLWTRLIEIDGGRG